MKKIQKYTHILIIILAVGTFAGANRAQADTEVGTTVLPPSTLPAIVNSIGDIGQGTVDTSTTTSTQKGSNSGGGGGDMISGLMDQMSKAIADSLPKGSIPATNCSPAGSPPYGRDGTACSVPVSVGAVGGVCQGGQCNAVSFTSGQNALQSFKDKLFKEVAGGIAKKLLSSLFGGGGGGNGSYPDSYTAPIDTGSGGFDTLDTTGLGTNTGLDSIFTDSSSTSLTYTPLSLATGKKNISPKINVITRVTPATLNTTNTTNQARSYISGHDSSSRTIIGNGTNNRPTVQGTHRTSPYIRGDNYRTQIDASSNPGRNSNSVTLSELTAGSLEAQRRAALLNEHAGAESLNNLRDYRSSNIVDRASNTNNSQSQKPKLSFWEQILKAIGGIFGL